MNILVLHTQVPFVQGGAEVLVNGLVDALQRRGHQVDTVSLPLSWNPVDELLSSALAWRLLDLISFNGVPVDRVICTKYPTWAVDHPHKSLWLIHQHRQAYDLHGTEMSEFGPGREVQAIRQRVHEIDRRGIGECAPRYAISNNVRDRLKKFSGIEAKTLYPPVPLQDLSSSASEPFILSVARLDKLKRVDPIIESWNEVDGNLQLFIVGEGPERSRLERLSGQYGLNSRVHFLGRVDEITLRDLYSRCRAVYYAPVDEDYGYATVEALSASKPVITAPDSGGVLEFIEHDVTGVVTALDPQSLAQAINSLANVSYASKLGSAGAQRVATGGWDSVVEALLTP